MASDANLVGNVLLGKLEVIRRLGGGGMGDVYEVEHRLTGHRRALKVVRPEFADRPRFMQRLLREAKVAGTLNSPFVVETFDAGRLEDGSAYVLMELLEGRSLYDVLYDEGPMPPRRLANIISQVAEGMESAHHAGIVHRDLKPENVFLIRTEQGQERVKILDFGVSKFDSKLDAKPTRLTTEGTLIGTPYYMSPEQAGGAPVDRRGDIYALGVMMYEALTGRLPFEADSVGELFVKIGAGQYVSLEARLPDLDPTWARIVDRAMNRKRESRYPTAEALRRDLLPLLEGADSAARAQTISERAPPNSEAAIPTPSTKRESFEGDDEANRGHSQNSAEEEPLPSGDERSAGAPASATSEDPPSAVSGVPRWAWLVAATFAIGAVAVALAASDSDRAPDVPDARTVDVGGQASEPPTRSDGQVAPSPTELPQRSEAPPGTATATGPDGDEDANADAPDLEAANPAPTPPPEPRSTSSQRETAVPRPSPRARTRRAGARSTSGSTTPTRSGAAGLDPNPYR